MYASRVCIAPKPVHTRPVDDCVCSSLGPPEKKKKRKKENGQTDKRINPTVGGGGGCGDNHRRRRRRLSDPRVCVLHRHVRYGRRRSVSLSRFRFFFVIIIIFKTYIIRVLYSRTHTDVVHFLKIFHYFTRTDSDDLELYVPAKVAPAPVITRFTVVAVG